MNDEQNIPGNTPEGDEETNKGFDPVTTSDSDDYYAVDDPKKEVISAIGDGEMHNEGLVGEGDIPKEGIFEAGTAEDQAEVD
jgi:hypothetical protein